MTKPKGKDRKQLSTEERLFKALEKEPVPTGPLITSSKIFEPFLTFVRYYLQQHMNSQLSRETVSMMAFAFRQEALARFGHDTIETYQLAMILRIANKPNNGGPVDVLTYLVQTKRALNVTQISAVEHIRKVWEAFGKGLMIGGRDLTKISRSNGSRSPIDNVGDDFYEEYKKLYVPWYDIASKIAVARRKEGPIINLAGIVFRIVVEDVYPEHLDRAFEISEGTCHRLLTKALTYYWEPVKLPKAAKSAMKSA